MHRLTGYCDAWSVKPGGSLGFKVSSAGDDAFDLRFVRLICADPNPRGPGYCEIAMPTALDGRQPGQFQPALPGSYARASLAAEWRSGIAISVTFWPTAPQRGEQAIVCLAGDEQLTLGIDADGAAFIEAFGTTRATVSEKLLNRYWYDLAAGQDADGTLWISQRPRPTIAVAPDTRSATASAPSLRLRGPLDILIAARPAATGFFNGKIERPTLWQGGSAPALLLDLQRQPRPDPSLPGVVAMWDFSRGIPGNIAFDIGPAGADAALFNIPGRGMTGAAWTGAEHDWTRAPEHYGAIHFHEDDVGDLGWRDSFTLRVPDDWPSGCYAAHIRNDASEDMIPFFVRPVRPTADVVLLAPTYTYQVYGNHALPGRGAELHERALAWGALTETPDMNPQFGLSAYNRHADGSGVAITSLRRPMLDTRPKQSVMLDPGEDASGTSRICSDSYIIHWLTTIGVAHDVVTDHDLHAEGAALLAPYRVAIAAQHPEYLSERMMQSLETYLTAGGRMMYLGGNGFYWRAEPSAAEPHALEIRRAENGIRVWATEPGENYHAFGGGFGGLWRRIGRPAHRLVGSGFSAQGRQLGFPYRFTEAILDPRVAFMRAGLAVEPGEAFGATGFMGGGAVGFELDSIDRTLGTPLNTLVVAKGVVIHPDYFPVNEDRLATRLPKATEDWSCADMLFFETAAGGAVFTVGSMTFVGSLAIEGYASVLGRLTTNVLRRFLDPEPFAAASLPPASPER